MASAHHGIGIGHVTGDGGDASLGRLLSQRVKPPLAARDHAHTVSILKQARHHRAAHSGGSAGYDCDLVDHCSIPLSGCDGMKP